jgi:hypothetical protein
MRCFPVIVPETDWTKVEGFVAGRTGGPAKMKHDGFGPNRPGTMTGNHLISL